MPEIPRRLPPTAAERLTVVVSRMAGGSAAGATRWAQPVASTTYRAADAPAPAEHVVSTAPLLAVLLQQDTVDYQADEFGDPTFYDHLTLPGLQPGRMYLLESVVLASNYPGGGGGSGAVGFRFTGPTLDNGTTQLYVNTAQGSATTVDPYGRFDVVTVDPETQWVSTLWVQGIIGVSYTAPAGSAITLQAAGFDPFRTMLVHPTTLIRATDIGPVPQIS